MACLATATLSHSAFSTGEPLPYCRLTFSVLVNSGPQENSAVGSGFIFCTKNFTRVVFSKPISVRVENLPSGFARTRITGESSLIGVGHPNEIAGAYHIEVSSDGVLDFYSQDNGLSFEAHFLQEEKVRRLFDGTNWFLN